MATSARLLRRFNGTTWDLVRPKPLMDSVTRRALDDVGTFATWLTTNGAQGIVGEVGWANDTTFTGDAALWNAVAAQWMAYTDRIGLDWQVWVAGPDLASTAGVPTSRLSAYYTDVMGGTTKFSGTQAPVIEAHMGLGTVRRGVNISSTYSRSVDGTGGASALLADGTTRFTNLTPGTRGTDYWYPTSADFAYLAARGVRSVSLRVRWERIAPTPGGALDTGEVAALQAAITAAWSNGIRVVVCIHNGWGYILRPSAGAQWDTWPLGQAGPVTDAHLVDLWSRLSTALSSMPGLLAYDLLNEPQFPACGIPSGASLVDGTFESGITGWTITGGSVTATGTLVFGMGPHSGTQCAQVTTSGALAVLTSPTFNVTPGTSYQLDGFFFGSVSGRTRYPSVSIVYYDANGGQIVEDKSDGVTLGTVQWRTARGVSTAPASAATAQIRALCRANASGEITFVDDLTVKVCTSPKTKGQHWQDASQQIVTTLRGAGDTTEVWVQPIGATITGLLSYNPTPWITDSANKTRYCLHHYWDRATGTAVYGSAYVDEVAFNDAAGWA